MNEKDTRRLNMVERVDTFGADHPAVFANATDGAQLLAGVKTSKTKLRTLLHAESAGHASVREQTGLRAEHCGIVRSALETIRRFAASIGTAGLNEKFRLPKGMSARSLVITARAFAEAAAPIADALIARGMSPQLLTDLPGQIQALEETLAKQGAAKEAHVGARRGVKAAYSSLVRTLKSLDAIVERGPNRDETIVGAWRNARRVGPAKTPPAVTGPVPAADAKTNASVEAGSR
jgi:hypothetical protein